MSSLHDNNPTAQNTPTAQKIDEILKSIGLTEFEVAVYLAALSAGSKPASAIAKIAGLKRGHTYNLLASLSEKGIVQEYTSDGVRHFTPSPPIALHSHLEAKEQRIKEQQSAVTKILPYLERLRNPSLSEPVVRYFRGVEGLKEIYEDTLRIKEKLILAIADFSTTFPQDKSSELHRWMWRYADRRAAKGIEYLGIVNKSKVSDSAYRKRAKQRRKLKMLRGIALPVEVNIYEDKVAIMSTSEDMVGVVIQDLPIATTLRNFHLAVWEYLPKYTLGDS